MALLEVKVPNLGDFKDVEIIEVHVQPGDVLRAEAPLITLETDKAAMEVPSPVGGVVREVVVKKGGKVSEGALIVSLEVEVEALSPATGPATEGRPVGAASAAIPATRAAAPIAAVAPEGAPTVSYSGSVDRHADVLVLGAGPGGYPAAFRAADLGLNVTLVERWATLGGVCLNVGCIPSKALLHAAKVIDEAESMAECGVTFGQPRIDLDGLRGWKNRIVGKLTGGLATLAKQRKVEVVRGTGTFVSPQHLEVTDGDRRQVIAFKTCIIAAGSEPLSDSWVPIPPR